MINIKTSKKTLEQQRDGLLNHFRPLLENKKVIFFDVPLYSNVGDSLIFLGSLELLKILNADIIDIITANEPDRLVKVKVCKDTVLICQGGGNFGDLYDIHQDFRHKIISMFPDNKVLLFPQSIHYSNQERLKNDCDLYSKSENFHLYVRDLNSFEMLKNNNVTNVNLCPDMATMLINKFEFSLARKSKNLNFLRKDIEATGVDLENSIDWCDVIGTKQQKLNNVIIFVVKKNNRLNIPLISYFLTIFMHRKLVKTAYKTFSKFDSIKTDRLHGMIFSQLLQMPCEALDNSYGKLQRYSKQWLTRV